MSLPTNKNLLALYPNEVFVETGAYRGDAIEQALQAGFQSIISLDRDPEAISFCSDRFDLHRNPDQRIWLHCANSYDGLWPIIENIDKPITFWLDAHWQMLEDTEPGDHPFPLLDELDQIAKHQINTHTIMIDDMLIMQDNIVGYNRDVIVKKLRWINRNYKLTFHPNPVINGILVAHLD